MLEINKKLVSREVCKLLFSVIKTAFNSQHFNILHFCIEVVRYIMDLIMFQTINSTLTFPQE